MDEATLQSLAQQLRQPQGEYAVQVGEKMNESNLRINHFTIEALSLSESDNILEIGMGNGFFVKDIFSVNPSVHYSGCDFSEIMVEEALRHNESYVNSGRAAFFLANAGHLPFPEDTFDKVFTVNTIYFWENTATVLAEIRRVLKPQGQITIALRPKSVMEQYPFVRYGFQMFSKEDLVPLISANGFEVTAVIEKKEPEQEFGGALVVVESLIVSAEKI